MWATVQCGNACVTASTPACVIFGHRETSSLVSCEKTGTGASDVVLCIVVVVGVGTVVLVDLVVVRAVVVTEGEAVIAGEVDGREKEEGEGEEEEEGEEERETILSSAAFVTCTQPATLNTRSCGKHVAMKSIT